MNSSRTRFGRISIKAELPAGQGEGEGKWSANAVGDGRGAAWCERDGEVSGRRVFGFIPRMEVEDLGSETAFRATLDWFWRSRVPAFPGGRVRSLQVLRDSSLSLSLPLSVSSSLSSGVRIWIRTLAHRATPRHAAPRCIGRHRR